jgi:uncharacterized protein (TIGR03435 family)
MFSGKRVVRIMADRVARKLYFVPRLLRSMSGVVLVALLADYGFVHTAQIGAQPQVKSAGAKVPAFDVASIRPSKPDSDIPIIRPTRNGVRIRACTLRMLITSAYGLHRFGDHPIVGAPKWADSDRYDIEAKMTESDANAFGKLSVSQQEQRLDDMLQALLADRFKLAIHKKPIDIPVYDLVIAKNGSKLKEGKPDQELPNGAIHMTRGQIIAEGIHIGRLADVLGSHVQRGVIDKTGLTGTYTFTLKWQAEEGAGSVLQGTRDRPQDLMPQDDSSQPSIFTALQEQLGLRLITGKAPGEALVVDHAEKPSPN